MGQEAAEAALMVEERAAGVPYVDMGDQADHKEVVADLDSLVGQADQVRRDILQQRGAERSGPPAGGRGEPVDVLAGEAGRQLGLVTGQDVDREMVGGAQVRPGGRGTVHIEGDQGWFEADGGERRGSEADRDAVVLRGDDHDAAGVHGERLPELVGRDGAIGQGVGHVGTPVRCGRWPGWPDVTDGTIMREFLTREGMITRRLGGRRGREGRGGVVGEGVDGVGHTREHESGIRRLQVRDQRQPRTDDVAETTWERLVRRNPWLIPTTLGRDLGQVNISYRLIG